MKNKFNPSETVHLSDSILLQDINYVNSYDFSIIHRHNYFEFILFEEGEGGRQIIDFEEYKIEGSTLYIILPGQVHLMKRLPNENGMLIQFTKEFLATCISPLEIDWLFQLQAFPMIKLTEEQFANLYYLFRKLKKIFEGNEPRKRPKLTHLFGYLFFELLDVIPQQIELSTTQSCAFQFMLKVEKEIKRVKTVKEYAVLLNVPINKLTREVKKHFGKSPLEFIHDLLLIEIKRCMMVEKLTHKEIAYTLNFDSQSSYSRFIKKQTLLQPSELRKQLNQIAQ